ncbi:Amidase [Fusarium sp. LHS14.1]|nr:Amidase [Fusarium sp. LHS14.1]
MSNGIAHYNDYLDRAAKKRAQQLSLIPPEWRITDVPSIQSAPNALDFIRRSNLLSPDEQRMTETLDARDLLQKIAGREISALDAVRAFAKRAAFAHQLTTCCTEIFFEQAFADAKKLDEVLEKTGKVVGPLHGLPVSIKDNLSVKGVDTTIGWVGLMGKPAMKDCNAVAALRRLGAIPFVKTNVPQSLMMSDSYNHLFGQCVNSLNRNLISGGSSGGESSLISFHGSPLGIGTDIGGSIRIPAALCGLYGLSPSVSRHPYPRGGPRQSFVIPTAGPIASSLATIESYMEALEGACPWEQDPLVSPIPWRKEKCSVPPGKKLRIGFVVDDGVVRPQPPIARAIRKVVALLQGARHEVLEWDSSSHAQAWDLFSKAILSDGGATAKRYCELSGEPLIEGMLVGTSADLLTTEESHQLFADKYTYEDEYLRRWHLHGLDALIMPVTPWVGYKPKTWVKSNQYVGYTSIFNLLNWSALTMPVCKVSKSSDLPVPSDWEDYRPRNPSDEFNKNQYDFDLVEGMPIGVQVTCGKYEEERCIAIGKVIEELLQGSEGE